MRRVTIPVARLIQASRALPRHLANYQSLRDVGSVIVRTAPRFAARIRSAEIVEAIAGVAIIGGGSLLVPGNWGFLGWAPHPLWIVVLAIAVRYAAPAGYVASILAGGTLATLGWVQASGRGVGLSEQDLIEPFLMVVVGMLLSIAVQGQRQRLAESQRTLVESDGKLQTIATAYQSLRTTKLELEKQIVGQPASITALYRIAKQLESLRVEDLYPALLEVIEEFLECQACALYLVADGALHLHAAVPESVADRPAMLPLDAGLVGDAISERRVVTVRDRLLQQGAGPLVGEMALIAGPLVDPDGELLGVIVIERIPFLKFTPATVSLLSIILDWASAAVWNATLHARTRDRLIEDDATGAYTAAHTLRLIEEHMQRGRRYGTPLCIVVVHLAGAAAAAAAERARLLRRVVERVRGAVRAVDVIGLHPDEDTITMILPMTALDRARVVAGRLGDDLRDAQVRLNGADHPARARLAVVSCTAAHADATAVLADAAGQLAGAPESAAPSQVASAMTGGDG